MPVWCDTETYLCNENNCFSSMDPCTWEDEYAGGSDMQGNVYKVRPSGDEEILAVRELPRLRLTCHPFTDLNDPSRTL